MYLVQDSSRSCVVGAGGVLAAHGPSSLQATWVNPIPDQTAGFTWDGGPRPQAPLIMFAPFPIGRSQPLVHATVGAVAGDTNDAAEIVEFEELAKYVGTTCYQLDALSETYAKWGANNLK